MGSKVTADGLVKRGPESWAYIYITLGFTLTIEGTVISLITPLVFPWNVLVYAVVGVATVWLFLYNGRFQNKLIGWKANYEQKFR